MIAVLAVDQHQHQQENLFKNFIVLIKNNKADKKNNKTLNMKIKQWR